MAYLFKRGDYWHVRYKDESKHWKMVSTKVKKKSEAEFILKQYQTHELNHFHNASVRVSTMKELTLTQWKKNHQ